MMIGENKTADAPDAFDKCLTSNLVMDDYMAVGREREREKRTKPSLEFEVCFSERIKKGENLHKMSKSYVKIYFN